MLVTRRSRLAVLAAGVAGLALVAALVIGTKPNRAPQLAAPGTHFTVSAAASANGPVSMGNGVFAGGSLKNDRSPALRDIPPHPVRALPAEDEEDRTDTRATPSARDTVVQSTAVAAAMPAAIRNFDGIGFPGVSCNCAPPDTNGEVGATQYVQIVNEGYQVFNKSTGASVLGPVGITTIWSGFGGVCETAGDGDPVVLYDQIAGRWLVSQFAGAGTPTDECIAISTTSDATGAYYRYGFHLGSNFFDYPHLAVWPDGYYMSDNVFNAAGTAYLGPQPFVFDRAKMLVGQPATFQTRAALGSSIDPILPADLDGSTPPPANAPETFVRYPGFGTYQTYHYQVNWATPASSTWTTFASPAAAGFSQVCGGGACVPQSGTTSTLDTLGDRLMFRLAYRNFGDHESVVGNYTVASGGVSGIRWFELRGVTAGPETVFQESTYQPDTTWRWMGSAAMNHNGDIAIGFSASSSAIHPEIRYAGRLAGDALNTLGQGETTLFSGAGSQVATSSRWGDYSDLTIDPVDDCTFWFTTEYYSTTTSFNWRTRIGSFILPGCGTPPPPPGAIAGHVTNSSSSGPIAGATVSITGGSTTTTDGSGAYTFSGLAPATYSLTASKTGFTTSSPASVAVTSGNTTTRDFALAPTATITSTAFIYAANSIAGPGGDGNGYETAKSSLRGAPDGAFASDVNSGTASGSTCTSATRDTEDASSNTLGALGSILGIRVQLVGKASSQGNSPKFCVQLSSDSGASWTTGKISGALKTSVGTFTLGTTADTWGRAWSAADFGSGFRVRIIDLANSASRTFYLDSVAVSVTYQ
jgi:carboxypeptidase family protein